MSVHEEVKYPCNQFEYKAAQKGHLKRHKMSIHEGIKYPSNQCEYKAAHEVSLKKHKISLHEGIKHQCNQCECGDETKVLKLSYFLMGAR